jgi:hypothetical protein
MPEDESPDSPILLRYYDLRQYMGLDLLNLDRAYMETSKILQEAGELAAKADYIENASRHTLDIIRAEASARLRTILIHGKEPSEARIAAMLPLETDVQDAREALDKARYEAAACSSLYKSLEAQSRLLGKASDMVMSSYYAPTAAYADKRRVEMRDTKVIERKQPSEKQVGRPVD